VAHRDYTSNGSVQVMLFKDRLEIWNPGTLPLGLSPEKLRQPHRSIPANPLLAEPMYLAGYIERMGTGTGDIIRLCNEAGLKEPEFIQEEDFRTVIWRTLKTTVEASGEVSGEPTEQAEGVDNEEVNNNITLQATQQATPQATPQADEEVLETVKRVVLVLEGDLKRVEIQELLGLRDRVNFVSNYLEPSLFSFHIEMTIPEIPTHQEQRYRLTDKGLALKKKLQKSKKKK
jgi:ATP-dependent DNA helicase RecG